MTPTNIETSTDARSKSRVELAPTMPCKKEEDLRSTKEERQAYVREKWECMHNCELCGKNATYLKDVMQKPSMLNILKERCHTWRLR